MAKYKLKTKRAAAKRYRVTGSGKIRMGRKGKRHIFTGKSRKVKRQLKGSKLMSDADVAMARVLIPYL